MFIHTCNKCIILGTHNGYDIYVHPHTPPLQRNGFAEFTSVEMFRLYQTPRPDFIARISDHPNDKATYPGFQQVLWSAISGGKPSLAIMQGVFHTNRYLEMDLSISSYCGRGLFIDCEEVDRLFLQ